MNFLAQVQQHSTEQLIGYGGGATVLLVIVGTAKDLIGEWIKNRTNLGKKIKNGSGCKVTDEVIGVIMEKDGEGRRLVHNMHAAQERTHKEMMEAQVQHALILQKIATILEGIERRK